jgi:RNA polymerase sigma factor (sigma-70 family)
MTGPMRGNDLLVEAFETNRPHLRSVAYRMLGSATEAEDAVQETWLRLSRSDRSGVENLAGWLTTVVSRVCLDMLRSRRSRAEEPLDERERPAGGVEDADPEREALLGDSVGLALLVVLDRLSPGERVAFVLHDMFGVSFEEIAPIVGRNPAAARQLASRARRRVRGATADGSDLVRQRELVDAFLAASRRGDFGALLAVLDPEVVLRADHVAVQMGAEAEVRGAAEVAETFSGRARAARPAVVDGAAGAVWMSEGRPRIVFAFTIEEGKIAAIDLLADPERLEDLDLATER